MCACAFVPYCSAGEREREALSNLRLGKGASLLFPMRRGIFWDMSSSGSEKKRETRASLMTRELQENLLFCRGAKL